MFGGLDELWFNVLLCLVHFLWLDVVVCFLIWSLVVGCSFGLCELYFGLVVVGFRLLKLLFCLVYFGELVNFDFGCVIGSFGFGVLLGFVCLCLLVCVLCICLRCAGLDDCYLVVLLVWVVCLWILVFGFCLCAFGLGGLLVCFLVCFY